MSKPQTPGFHLNNFIVGSKFTRKLRDETFPVICGSGGSKSRLAKAAVAEPAGQLRDDKLHAVVAPSTFPSENVQNTWVSEHFWKLRCRKSARRCGAKHICKSKCTKRTRWGPLLGVERSKKCTPLWREAHFQDFNSTSPLWNDLSCWWFVSTRSL